MKLLLVLVTTLTVTTQVFARSHDPELEVKFLSWCENNKVMSEGSNGQVELKMDCTLFDKACKTKQVNKPNMTFFFATCEEV